MVKVKEGVLRTAAREQVGKGREGKGEGGGGGSGAAAREREATRNKRSTISSWSAKITNEG